MSSKILFKYSVSTVLALLALSVPAVNAFSASYMQHSQGFYERKAEGWFWYDDPLEAEETELPLPEPLEQPIVALPDNDQEIISEQVPDHGPKLLSAAWLREAMPKYLELAIDNPTVENVRAYMYLQRIMMDKAERYALATQRVVTGDPLLDETTRRPLASFAIQAVDAKSGREQTHLLQKIANSAGLFFFFSSACQKCMAQAPLIKSLQKHLGFAVMPVSVDGKNMTNSPWAQFKTDEGHARHLNIKALPAIYLASSDGQFELVGQSVYSLPELKDRILFAAARKGWVTQKELNQTRPVLDSTNVAEIIDLVPEDSKAILNPAYLTDGVIPSSELMRYIENALEHGDD